MSADRRAPDESLTYKSAGVDIEAGNALVDRIKPLARKTMRPEVVAGIGGFSGLCAIPSGYKNPLLVSGTDGVGTKLKSAFATGRHDTVGIDLVAMCVNDVIVTGAEPLFFLDYFATGKLEVEIAEQVITGITEGCKQAGCALLGGETAELPGFYPAGEYDLAGFAVGVVERDQVKDGRALRVGDRIIGMASSGLHSNGHSLARKVILEHLGLGWDDRPAVLAGATVADELIRPTKIYVSALRALTQGGVAWKGAAHITGGGLVDNPPRLLPQGAGLGLRLYHGSWPVLPIFRLLQDAGVPRSEMPRAFNMGLGMLVAVAREDERRALGLLIQAGHEAFPVGDIIEGDGEVEFIPSPEDTIPGYAGSIPRLK
ncbi:MAG: phosphoribosylformylglycinamidine cyclo-ligase [Deltaproteobacteria bacterium]|nr:phosphoribosylformylglycinamidine cyclo-ligase [Deltaproteobacteria bacterium]